VTVHAMTGKDQSGHRPGAVPRSERPRAAPVPVNFGSEQALTLQRLAGNHATAATLTASRLARSGSVVSRKASSNQPAPKTQIDVLTERVNILERRQRADAIDLKWRAIFGERYDSYLQALLTITNGINAAAATFRNVQSAQAQTDQMRTQVIGLVLSVGTAAIFEPLATAGLGFIGMEAAKIKSTVEILENPIVAAVSGGATNIKGTMQAGESAQSGAPPASVQPAGGSLASNADAFHVLTDNQAQLVGLHKEMEAAFAERANKLAALTDDEWKTFDPTAHEAKYRQHLETLDKGPKMERLKDARTISAIYERYMWAAWLPSHMVTTSVTKAGVHYSYSLGTDVEDGLREAGISALAGVVLTGHWYSSNSPSDWGPRLLKWCKTYTESIAKG